MRIRLLSETSGRDFNFYHSLAAARDTVHHAKRCTKMHKREFVFSSHEAIRIEGCQAITPSALSVFIRVHPWPFSESVFSVPQSPFPGNRLCSEKSPPHPEFLDPCTVLHKANSPRPRNPPHNSNKQQPLANNRLPFARTLCASPPPRQDGEFPKPLAVQPTNPGFSASVCPC
jgi:hypothetical protein